MFSRVAKGARHYREANVEANLFRKTFPGIPLTGFFGDGEIGLDVLPNFRVDDDGGNSRAIKDRG